jgi:hypothetical protein
VIATICSISDNAWALTLIGVGAIFQIAGVSLVAIQVRQVRGQFGMSGSITWSSIWKILFGALTNALRRLRRKRPPVLVSRSASDFAMGTDSATVSVLRQRLADPSKDVQDH